MPGVLTVHSPARTRKALYFVGCEYTIIIQCIHYKTTIRFPLVHARYCRLLKFKCGILKHGKNIIASSCEHTYTSDAYSHGGEYLIPGNPYTHCRSKLRCMCNCRICNIISRKASTRNHVSRILCPEAVNRESREGCVRY